MKKRNRNIAFYMLAFLIPVVIMLISMDIKACYPFGKEYTILAGDSKDQYIQFFHLLFDRLKDGKSFLFSWDTGMGFDFLTNFWYYLSNPCNWIVLLFGQAHIELGMICAILLQIGGCAVTAFYFFLHSKINRMKDEKWNTVICLLFSIAYALCDYVLAYEFNIMWLMGMMLVPLLMLSMEYLVDKYDGRLYGILLFIGFVSNFYFAWFLCIWAMICFIDQKKEDFKHWKRVFLKFVLTSIVSALCAGAILLPSYLAVLFRSVNDLNKVSAYGLGEHALLGNFFSGFFWSHTLLPMGERLFTQNNYCGIFVLILAFLYFFNRNIDRLQKVKRGSLIFVLSVGMNWIGLSWILHGFTIPNLFTNRFTILLIFLLLMTAYESLYKLEEVRCRYIAVVALLFFGIFIMVLFNSDLSENTICYLVTMFLILYLFICFTLHRRHSISKTALIVNLCVIGFAELLLNPFFSSAYTIFYRTDTLTEISEWRNEYASLGTEYGERKTTFFSTAYKDFAYSQTNIFSSVINSGILDLFGNTGLANGKAGVSYMYIGSTPLTAVLMNVRYVLTDQKVQFGGYVENEQMNDLYETDDLAGFGFMLPETVAEWQSDATNMFEVQNNFTRDVLGTGNLFTQAVFDNISKESYACEILECTDEDYYYMNQCVDDSSYAYIHLNFVVPEDMDLYLFTIGANVLTDIIYIDGEIFYGGSFANNYNTYHIGKLKRGQSLDVLILDMSGYPGEAYFCTYFYQYHDDVMQEALAKMRESVYEIDTFEDTYVSGTVDAAKDGILYTSIPYYKGFTAYVDGKKTEIVKIGDAMTGVRVPAGKHTVEFRYFTYGLKTGIGLSILGFLLVIINAVYAGKRRKNLET